MISDETVPITITVGDDNPSTIDAHTGGTNNNDITEGTDTTAEGGWDVTDTDTPLANYRVVVSGVAAADSNSNPVGTARTYDSTTGAVLLSGNTPIAGVFGTFTFTGSIATSGSGVDGDLDWSYAANAQLGMLADGTYTETLSLTIGGRSQSIVIDITGENNAPASGIAGGNAISLGEDTAAGSVTGITFTPTDADTLPSTQTLTVSLDPTTNSDLFEVVDPETDGTWTLKLKAGSTLNFEDLPMDNKTISLTVRVSDGVVADDVTENIVITVTDVNDVTPVLNQAGTGTIMENAMHADGIDTGISFTVTDPDTVMNTHRVTITEGNPSGAPFEIRGNNTSGWSLWLKANTSLNYEDFADTNGVISLKLVATDDDGNGNESAEVTVMVTVMDLNEAPSIAAVNDVLTGEVAENDDGADVTGFALTFTDPDDGDAPIWTVSDSRFEVVADGSNWKLKLKTGEMLDHENDGTNGVLSLSITATDNDDTPIAAPETINVTVTITDANDAHVFALAQNDDGIGSVAEDDDTVMIIAEKGTGIFFTLTDVDEGPADTFDFSVSGDPDNRFDVVHVLGTRYQLVALTTDTGETHRTAVLDHDASESARTVSLQVTASDMRTDGSKIDSAPISVTVDITNINDQDPTLTFADTAAGNIDDADRAVDADFDDIILRPVDPDTLHTFEATDFRVEEADDDSLSTRFKVKEKGGNFILWYDYDSTDPLTGMGEMVMLNITVTTPGGTSLARTATISVGVSNTDPRLPVAGLTEMTLMEGGRKAIATANLEYEDGEQGVDALVYSLTSSVSSGSLIFNNGVDGDEEITWAMATGSSRTFTQGDINAGRIYLVHDGSEDDSAVRFSYEVYDGTATVSGTFTTAPVIGVDALPTVSSEAESVAITEAADGIVGYERSPADGAAITFSDDETEVAMLTVVGDPEGSNDTIGTTAATRVDGDSGYGRFVITRTNSSTEGTLTWYYELNNDNATLLDALFAGVGATDTVTIRIDDGTGTNTHRDVVLTANITGANEDPDYSLTENIAINNGGTLPLTASEITVTDDRVLSAVTLLITGPVSQGKLSITGDDDFTTGDSFTMDEITGNSFTYTHTATNTNAVTDSFTFSLTDGEGGTETGITYDIIINQAPDIDTDTITSADNDVTEDSGDSEVRG